MFIYYICVFCESIVRAPESDATPVCLNCWDYKGLERVGTGTVTYCDCDLSMCPECDPDFYHDMEHDFV